MTTTREDIILSTLRNNAASMHTLQSELYHAGQAKGYSYLPTATVRRTIGDLRRKGYVINTTLPNSMNSRYVLVSEPQATA